MIKVFSKKINLFIAIAILFAFGQLAGSLAIRHFYMQSKLEELAPQAKQMADAYADGQTVQVPDSMIIRLYDLYGKEIAIGHQDVEFIYEVDFDTLANKYMPKLLTSQTVSALERVDGLPSVSVVVGVPMVRDGATIGGLFILMPASVYSGTLWGFFLVFGATLAVGLLLIGVFFRQYIVQVRELEETRRNYIANISHELKSPIASVRALTETLADNMVKDEETKQRYYDIILAENSRLENLVMDVLDLSKIQSGKMDFVLAKLDAEEIFLPVCKKYKMLCDDMGIGLSVSERINNLPPLFTNKERVSQLLVILLDNAVKFVGEEGEIRLDARVHGGKAVISVSDNGVGIEKDILPYVFDRFYKGDTAHNSKGSGLGLAIAEEITAGLKERIRVQSQPGRGTVFTFTVAIA
ncbi:sensor histidine kinase [Parasporobacterium paucivorans]|uniref:histidine kinase n=1 Tax=Parasporobacterium paucivorans DSM 15970 TaxID=1122934 RepID=A0A1M6K0W1_9FIRM|nr:HAMP domain-containing sensor histidine kinase [Parasporobacterium paucivorans]SHJ52482.1 His Kinase A (phospho-acceptor) domain-containing protein [Parasporobacterium paucivorans DSM 15970]